MFDRPLFRARLRLHRWAEAVRGWKVYFLALVIALPDMLDALAGVDVTTLLPAWMPGAKWAALLAVARAMSHAYALGLGRALPPGGPRP
ncbi:hypothetical protein [Methylobacterium gnaphalii]|uniref:Uncharacterized protein n=1 Tax=Methylobacterium gnaphalii TaxID=1010610 RepID=A0A512JIK8_9HYPH|nr:hypothetical protein [Methylobacterium gnaphalii]GEP09791.1 hypothetical protein MGN01_16360 [Methylobacterium gnaphalii]GJD67294.1 hypothetical protein MMMDOFMJ_0208 [Methylobacterium gnaphalii]GLS49821.1 hypothetical protein GCM10007885_26730 [Methylobacterium gnaphalii]